jgi:hypothetical protein
MDCQYHSRPHRLDTSRFDVTGLELLDFVIPPIDEYREAWLCRRIRQKMLSGQSTPVRIGAMARRQQRKDY